MKSMAALWLGGRQNEDLEKLILTHLSSGFTPIWALSNFPVTFSNTKWLLFVVAPDLAPMALINSRLGSESRGYPRLFLVCHLANAAGVS